MTAVYDARAGEWFFDEVAEQWWRDQSRGRLAVREYDGAALLLSSVPARALLEVQPTKQEKAELSALSDISAHSVFTTKPLF